MCGTVLSLRYINSTGKHSFLLQFIKQSVHRMVRNIVICPPATFRHLYKFTFLSGQSNTEVWNAKLTYTQFHTEEESG